ncbi:DUF317 domain-containing protein [Streptomyces sp. CA-111067]|uniref:DUF317 domain-containing protein n=1 Tax=Streptomyces sp. CA-111067 TaxID=3240046 RepID=UPI003D978665
MNDEDQVLISPRYMAGTGPVQDAIGPLIHLFDWPWIHDSTTGRITATSPDQTTTVDFDPSERFGRWWAVTHRGEQDRRAEFTRHTPAETVAAVTLSLPQLLGDRRHIEPLNVGVDPFAVTSNSGWRQDSNGHATSSDGHCTLWHTPGSAWAWWVEADVYGKAGTQWDAAFSTHAPTALVTRFVTRLTTPEPVQRRYGSIPGPAVPFALITPVCIPLGNAQLAHALGQLGAAARRHR